MDQRPAPLSRLRSGIEANARCREATYWRIATTRIRTDIAIHNVAQTTAGTPVAFAIFRASVGTVAANGEDRNKTVFRSSSAFKTHCTANKLTTKVATRAEANRATANSPAVNKTPANKVKGSPLNESQAPANSGLMTPKIMVNASTTAAEPNSTMRAATARRISTSNKAPKV